MNKNINYGMILSVILVIVLLIGGISYSGKVSKLEDTVSSKDVQITNMATELGSVDQRIADAIKDATAEAITTAVETTTVEEAKDVGYSIDGKYINESLNQNFSDRELNLFDGKVDLGDEEYNMDEYLYVPGMKLSVNEEDFGSDVYAVIKENDISYEVKFDDFNNSFISKDDSLVFNFLGNQVEVIKWDNSSNEVTFKSVDEQLVSEGESITVGNITVSLELVMVGSVYVTIDGKSKKISEGESSKIGDVEVYVSEVLYTAKNSKVSKAVLAIGSDVEYTVKNDDQYKDSVWDWKITDNSIGIVLAEDFKDLDEDNMPLAIGDAICLPNDYVCVKFAEMSDEDYNEYKFEYKDGEMEIRGDFEVGTEDVDKLIVNVTGVYYEDEENVMRDASSAELKDSDATFSYINRTISIEDVYMDLNCSDVNVDSNNEKEEGSYRSVYGSIIELNDDLEANDNELSISVPEEQVEFTFLVY